MAVSVLTVIGAGLRLWNLGGLGLSHFDEGVYALAGSWSLAPGGLPALAPALIPYAPPGFPILVGLAYLILGFADVSAILVSMTCGVATIVASAWLGRRTFGPGAGAAAAALGAGSLAHVAFSRKALTDSPFLLAWLVAIGLGARFLERPTLGRAIAAGAAVGLAQNFKYNGWLLGLILAGAAGFDVLARPASERWQGAWRRDVLRLAVLLVVSAVVALVVYAPWIVFVERNGGYASLVRHHRSYLGGVGSWYAFLTQQLAQVVSLSGGASWDASRWVAAWFAAAWVRGAGPQTWSRTCWVGLVAGAILSGANASLGWWLGFIAAPWLLIRGAPAGRMLGTWWLLLSLLTPFYHPYARLWLPLATLGWLMTAGLIVELSAWAPTPKSEATIHLPRWLVDATVAAVLAGGGQQWWTSARPLPLARLFQNTDTLRMLTQKLPDAVPLGTELHVLARRPLSFYLLVQGRYSLRLLSGIDDLERSVPAGGWVILDGAVLDDRTNRRLEGVNALLEVHELLDPVTLLDVAPGAAYLDADRGPVEVRVLRWPLDARELPVDERPGSNTPP